MAGLHSAFAPSSAERIIECPASFEINRRLPESSSIYAETGTVAHTVLDRAYRQGVAAARFAGEVHNVLVNGVAQEITVTEEMVEAVQECLDRFAEMPGDHYPEHRVEVSRWCPPDFVEAEGPQFGTCDRAALSEGVLRVADLKYGEGVQVWAAENPQLILYALGIYDAYDWAYSFKRVELHICQPRLDHYDVWTCTIDELLQHGSRVKAAFIAATKPDAPYGPTEKACKFCKIRATCGPLAAQIQSAAALAFDDLTETFEPSVPELSIEQVVEGWRVKALYNLRFAAIEELLVSRGLAGDPAPGTKIVEGRSNRRWKSDAEAVLAMDYAGVPKKKQTKSKLIGPAAAQKLLPKDRRALLAEVIVKPPGAPTLVDADDPRPAWGSRAGEAFDDLSGLEIEE
jgi:hypothetical protein